MRLQTGGGGVRQKAQTWFVFERLLKHNETFHVFQNKADYTTLYSVRKNSKIQFKNQIFL
jgi:hypothetical protein